MLIDKQEIEQLIPHAGSMCLLDCVIHWDDDSITCLTATHRDPTNPLRGPNGLACVHAIEYAAQSIAIHGGLSQGVDTSRPGYIAAVREACFHIDRLDGVDADLQVSARCVSGGHGGLIYTSRVSANNEPVAEARIVIAIPAVS